MAFATAKKKAVTEIIGVELSLTKTEAEILVTVLRNVGGERYDGPRAYTDAILGQLYGVSIAPAKVRSEGSIVLNKLATVKKKSDPLADMFNPNRFMVSNGTTW